MKLLSFILLVTGCAWFILTMTVVKTENFTLFGIHFNDVLFILSILTSLVLVFLGGLAASYEHFTSHGIAASIALSKSMIFVYAIAVCILAGILLISLNPHGLVMNLR